MYARLLLTAMLFVGGCGSTPSDGGTGGAGGSGGGSDGGLGGGGGGGGGGGSGGSDGSTGGTDGSTGGVDGSTGGADMGGTMSGHIQRVFIVLMENANWSQWKGSSSAPYINKMLLPMASFTENYNNPAGIHPSLPNYIWLEAGDNLGVTADGEPSSYHQSTADHLVNQLEKAGHTWRFYAEDIDGTTCPLTDNGLFVARHVPVLYFDDVTNTNDANAARCKAHVRPYSELQKDLMNGTVADYNFITPNLCDDAHGSNPLTGDFTCTPFVTDLISKGDTFLSNAVPMITGSASFGTSSVLFVTWDEGESSSSDGPIGFIAVGANVKGKGYSNMIKYDHSSTLRTIEEIFGLPLLRGAQKATDLADLFTSFP